MEILEFLNSSKFFMILGLFVVLALLYRKLKDRRDFNRNSKKRK
ncbi:MAG: hypothetical protein AAFP76_00140 [Bacteroidota bacterium]